jgi:site-specific DNA-methyltransferase (adenine-specific)
MSAPEMPSDADLIAAGARRVERIADALLVLGDCRQIAPRLPRPDAIVTDPPYGIGYVMGAVARSGLHSGEKWGLHRLNALLPIVGDDQPFDPAPWLDGADHVLLWGANHYAARLPHGRWLAWNKLGGMQPWDSFSEVEFAWHNRRGADRIFSHLWKGLCQSGAGVKRDHPTQKPVELMEWCLEQAGNPRSVLDPYIGSGTTGVACLRRGVRFIGIEIEPRYFDVACRRIAEAARQPSLFDAAQAHKPQQMEIGYPVERIT